MKTYDAIIIGAGLGALSCGSYLTKAGKKILILEHHHKVGGYCTSFKRKNYIFDVGVHSLGSLRQGGQFTRVLRELDIELETVRPEITNYIKIPGLDVPIYKDFKETITYLKSVFTEDKNGLDAFSAQMDQSFAALYPQLRNKSFMQVLDELFTAPELKYILSLLLGNLGSTSDSISALAAIGLYREFIADGGYYPKGGMQRVADCLADCFTAHHGEIRLKHYVEEIMVKDEHVCGVRCSNGSEFFSETVVSNASVLATFQDLLPKHTALSSDYMQQLLKMEYSTSAFMVYLGINRDMRALIKPNCTQWITKKADFFYNPHSFAKGGFDDFLVCYTPSFHDSEMAPKGKDCLILITCTPFQPDPSVEPHVYWKEHKARYADKMIRMFCNEIGDFSEAIEVKEAASPYTLFRYTMNTEGSIYGWVPTIPQYGMLRLAPKTPLPGLYLVGHWTRPGAGISMVIQSGRLVSNLILAD